MRSPPSAKPPPRRACTCDRCWRQWGRPWPLSEVPPVNRRWGAFEVVRPLDVVLAHGPASFTEAEMVAEAAA